MLRLVIFKKEIINGKTKFNRYFTFMNLPEEFGGECSEHGVTVKFLDDLQLPKFAKKGILTIVDEENDISAPRVWKIKKDENGKDQYPTIWIRNFKDYTPIQPKKSPLKQNMFVVDEEDTEEVTFEN